MAAVILKAIATGGVTILLAVSSASGSLVTWEFAGDLMEIHDPNGFLGELFSVGMPYSGQFEFESTTADSFPKTPGTGHYDHAITDGFALLGNLPFDSLVGSITLLNDSFANVGDSFRLAGSIQFSDQFVGFFIDLSDSTGVALDDDTLPIVPPNLSYFDSTTFVIEFGPHVGDLVGELTSLTPEPGTLLLLAAGAVAIMRRR